MNKTTIFLTNSNAVSPKRENSIPLAKAIIRTKTYSIGRGAIPIDKSWIQNNTALRTKTPLPLIIIAKRTYASVLKDIPESQSFLSPMSNPLVIPNLGYYTEYKYDELTLANTTNLFQSCEIDKIYTLYVKTIIEGENIDSLVLYYEYQFMVAKAGQQSGILAVLYFALKDKLISDAPFVYDNDSIYDSRTTDITIKFQFNIVNPSAKGPMKDIYDKHDNPSTDPLVDYDLSLNNKFNSSKLEDGAPYLELNGKLVKINELTNLIINRIKKT